MVTEVRDDTKLGEVLKRVSAATQWDLDRPEEWTNGSLV